MAPFLALLVSLYPLPSGELPWAGWRETCGPLWWMFIGDDQIMLEPAEDAAANLPGYGKRYGGDGQWARPGGENWDGLEPEGWDGGGRVVETEEL